MDLMDLLGTLLTFPVSGPLKGVMWLAETLQERAEGEIYNEDAVRGRLMELELKLDMGEIGEDEYQVAEDELVALLVEIRERRAAEQES
jgi:hypothetical protein